VRGTAGRATEWEPLVTTPTPFRCHAYPCLVRPPVRRLPRCRSRGTSPAAGHRRALHNDIGQDNFSQIIWGTRSSLGVAVGAASLAITIGVLLGVGAGLVGGWPDILLMRSIDLFMAMPILPLLMMIAALAGSSRAVLIVVIGMLAWPFTARILRSQTLSLRQRGFIGAAAGFGASRLHVIRRHLVPALGPIIITGFVSIAGVAVALDAGLAFLGLGDPTGVSWGLVLNRALRHPGLYFTPLWTWSVLPAGFAITLAILAFTFVGIGLEARLNPRLARARGPNRPRRQPRQGAH